MIGVAAARAHRKSQCPALDLLTNTAAVQIAENVQRAMRGEGLLNQVDVERSN